MNQLASVRGHGLRLWMSVLTLTLTGCTVGPNYHRPKVPLPPAYPATARTSSPGLGSLGEQQWWKVFDDPALQNLIRKARTNNPSIAIAAARVALVRAQISALRSSYSPEVDAVANESLQRISPIGLPKDRTSGNPAGSATIFGAQASWEIDFWGKYRRANEAARASLLAGQAEQEAVFTSLVADVASAYFALLSLDEQEQLAQRSVSLRQSELDLIRTQVTQGVASAEAAHLAEARLEAARLELLPLVERVTERENELRALTGEPSGVIPRGRSLWAEHLPNLGPGIPSRLLERRPDIREAEQSLIAANANIGVAEAAYFPNVSLTAAGGLESTAFHNLFTSNASTFLLQPQVNVPVFAFGRIRAAVNEARAEQDALVGAYRGAVFTAFRDVADALAARQAAADLETSSEAREIQDSQSTTLAQQRLDQGVSSALEVMDAEGITLAALRYRAVYRGDQLISVVHLYRALGGGWQP